MVTYKQVLLMMIYNDGADDYAVIQNPTSKKLIICGALGTGTPITEADMALYTTGELEFNVLSSGQTPVAGKKTLYFKSGGLYYKDEDGTEHQVTAS